MPGIFISYRTGDDHYAAILIDEQLSAQFGADVVFRDSRAIPLGSDFPPHLWRELRASLAVIVVIGSRWLSLETDGTPRIFRESDYVRQEIREALRLGISVIPVLLGDTKCPTADQLPPDIAALAQRQYLRLDHRNPTHGIERLVTDLETLTGLTRRAESTPTPTPAVSTDQSHSVVLGNQVGRDIIYIQKPF